MRPSQAFVRSLLLVFFAVVVSGSCALAADFFDFLAPRIFPTNGNPTAVALADFNGDGKLDLAATTARTSTGAVAILLGNGDGTLGPPTTYPVSRDPSAIVAGDFNNDGYPDLAVVDDDGIQILLNNGDGTFRAGSTISGSWSANIVVADFNNDGNLDLAVSLSDYENSVTVLIGNGDGTFQSGVSSPAGSLVMGVAVGDFNRDGKPDLAVANYSNGTSGTNQLSILIGKGDGTFLPPARYPTPGLSYWVAVADFNHDGKTDVAISNLGPDKTDVNVEIFLGNGDGTMRRGKNYHADYTNVWPLLEGLVLGDFTGDRNPDLAIFDVNGLTVMSAGEKGDLHVQSRYAVNQTCDTPCFAAGSFVGNSHRQQLVVTDESGRGLSVLLDGADGIFRAPRVYPTVSGVNTNGLSDLVAGDFNGDGTLDLFATHYPLEQYPPDIKVTVSPGKGDGTFASPIITKIPVGGVQQFIPFAAAGDFDRDGKLDAAVTITAAGGQYNGNLMILLGKGNGSFRLGNLYQHSAAFGAMQVADFNHDGNLDIASACGDGVCILLGKGNGEFRQPIVYAIDDRATLALVVGDFDHDGNPDIAAIASCSVGNGCESEAILLGKGDGTFGSPTIYSDIDGPTAIAAGDFNGDGNLDLAIVDNDTNNNGGQSGGHMLLGDGKGTFRKTKRFAVGVAPTSLAAADFNHDGKLDLAVGNNDSYQGPSQLLILHGKGDGTFRLRTPYAVPGPVPMVVGNFKKNGDPDLAGFTGDGVTVYLNSHSKQSRCDTSCTTRVSRNRGKGDIQ